MKTVEMIEINEKLYPHLREMTEEEEKNIGAKSSIDQIRELKCQLAETDYKAIKYTEGWINEEDYQPIKSQRQKLRNEINRLESLNLCEN